MLRRRCWDTNHRSVAPTIMTRKNAHLVLACWQAWTWLHELTSLNMVELASLNMVELASLNRVVDMFVHACWDRQLFMAAWWTNRLEQRCSYMIEVEHVVREWWNNKTEQRCYNNHELGCCIKSGFACSNIYANNPGCRFVKLYTLCWNMIEQYCYFTNPVLSC